MTGPAQGALTVLAPDGVPEIGPGDDLAALLVGLVALHEGDVVAVTSKAVAKAEGALVAEDRESVVDRETARVVARRDGLVVARTRHGLTLAAAGVDSSNVPAGHALPLPRDPDASARGLRARLRGLAGVNVAVLVTDTAGRAWRRGQVDLAVGAAGLVVLDPHAGRTDPFGNLLAVTEPAVADEIAGAAELVQGKLSGRPFAVLRGRPDLVLPPDQDGPGAAALVRPDAEDLFGLGAREAVLRALTGDPAVAPAFGSPASPGDALRAVRLVLGDAAGTRAAGAVTPEGGLVVSGDPAVLRSLAFALGWVLEEPPQSGDGAVLRPPSVV